MSTSISLERLVKRFGPLTAVNGVSLEIRRGEVFGLLGPNGAGKTTIVRMIAGLLSPDEGAVRFHDAGSPTASPRHRLGICPQEIIVWDSLTCHEQLRLVAGMYGLAGGLARERARVTLEALGLAEKGDVLARRLSGGMRRRLNLALAVIHEPDFLLLDEPEAGLDPQSRILVRQFVRSLAERTSVILTSHNMDEVDRTADRVGIMSDGTLLVVDTPEALKRQTGAGDTLRVDVGALSPELSERVLRAVRALRDDLRASLVADALVVCGLDAVNLIPGVTSALRSLGVTVRSLSLQANTLEDVFIALTGRSLHHDAA